MEELIAEMDARRPTIFDMMGQFFGDRGPEFGDDYDEDEDDEFW